MSLDLAEIGDTTGNPLDILEELIGANEWPYQRVSDDELVLEVAGRWADYHLFFLWRAELSGLHFSCAINARIPAHKRRDTADLLAIVNESLWLGHFDMCSREHIPMFRHTVPLRGQRTASVEQLEDLVDTGLSECERFYPALHLVIWGGRDPSDAVATAMLDTVGEA